MEFDPDDIALGEMVTLTIPDEPSVRMTVADAVRHVMLRHASAVDSARLVRADGTQCRYAEIAAIFARSDFPFS